MQIALALVLSLASPALGGLICHCLASGRPRRALGLVLLVWCLCAVGETSARGTGLMDLAGALLGFAAVRAFLRRRGPDGGGDGGGGGGGGGGRPEPSPSPRPSFGRTPPAHRTRTRRPVHQRGVRRPV